METIYDVFRALVQAAAGRPLSEPEVTLAMGIIDGADAARRQPPPAPAPAPAPKEKADAETHA